MTPDKHFDSGAPRARPGSETHEHRERFHCVYVIDGYWLVFNRPSGGSPSAAQKTFPKIADDYPAVVVGGSDVFDGE